MLNMIIFLVLCPQYYSSFQHFDCLKFINRQILPIYLLTITNGFVAINTLRTPTSFAAGNDGYCNILHNENKSNFGLLYLGFNQRTEA